MQQPMNESIEVVPEPEPVTGGGRLLREGRESRGLSVEQVAFDMRLTPERVRALEEEDFTVLPEPTYVCGYVRNYARYLNLSSDEIIACYPNLETLRPGYRPPVDTVVTRADLRKPSLDIPLPLVASVALLAIIVIWYVSGDDEAEVAQLAGAEQANQAASAEEQTNTAGNAELSRAPAGFAPVVSELADEEPQVDGSDIPRDGSMSKTTITNAAEVARSGDSVQMRVVEQAALRTLEKIEKVEQDVGTFAESDEAAEKANAETGGLPAQARVRPATSNLIPASKLTIRYTLDSWTDIVDAKGRKLIYKLGKAGTSTTVVGVAPFKAFFGYVPGVEMSVNDKPVDMTPYQLLETANIRVGTSSGNSVAYGIRPESAPDGSNAITVGSDRNRVRQELRQSLNAEDNSTQLSIIESEPKNAKPPESKPEPVPKAREKANPAPIFDLFSQ